MIRFEPFQMPAKRQNQKRITNYSQRRIVRTLWGLL
jgi:hypothetical protein